MEPKDRIIVALDVGTVTKARELVEKLHPHVGVFKFGLEFITSMLVQLVSAETQAIANSILQEIRDLFGMLDGNIFWDGKFDDIPNTVGGASKALNKLNVKMFNVHSSATINALMKAAAHRGNSLALAVTVLTSTDDDDAELTFGTSAATKVLQFARNAKIAGCDGIVCSPRELVLLGKHRELDGLLRVTPGIRSEESPPDDQRRTMTAAEAIAAGADYLVIGRPIIAAPDPVVAAKQIEAEIARAAFFSGSKR